jgi:hypothetical protein
MQSGKVEILIKAMQILNIAEILPFDIRGETVRNNFFQKLKSF